MIKVGAALLLGFGCCLVAGCGGGSTSNPQTTTLQPRAAVAALTKNGMTTRQIAAVLGGSQMATATTRIFINRSSSMEPTLHCKKGPHYPRCLGKANDRLVVKLGGPVKQGEIVVFIRPREAEPVCGSGAVGHRIYVKRVIGMPGDTVHEDAKGFIYINGKRLSEPYLSAAARLADSRWFRYTWHVPGGVKSGYLIMSDNRAGPCDPRGDWGYLGQPSIIGPVVKVIRTH
jgi:signal peptidase I